MTLTEEAREALRRRPIPGEGPRLWVPVNDEGKEVPEEFATRWRANRTGFVSALGDMFHYLTIRDNEELLMYDGQGVYDGGAPQFIKEWVEDRFAEKGLTTDRRFTDETISSIKRRTYRERYCLNPPPGICLLNGVIRKDTEWHLIPHDPAVPFTTRLPVRYERDAGCEQWLTFLNTVLPDRARLVQEMFGYCLVPGNPFKTAFFLVGPTDSGKSTLLEVLRGLLGRANTTTIALQSLSDNRFASSGLFGKLANIYTDLSPKLIRDAGLFKMLTGGSDEVPAEKKFSQPFGFVNPAKLLFSANTMPAVPWGDAAFFNRWIVVEFRASVPLEKQLPYYETVLLAESAGILNWALAGFDRLEDRGRFDKEVVEETRSKWRRLSDSLAWFAEEMVIRDHDVWVLKGDFYAAYSAFCEDHGLDVRSQTDVGRELPQLIPGIKAGFPKVGGKTVRAWLGIQLRHHDTEDFHAFHASTPTSGILHETPKMVLDIEEPLRGTIPEVGVEGVEGVEDRKVGLTPSSSEPPLEDASKGLSWALRLRTTFTLEEVLGMARGMGVAEARARAILEGLRQGGGLTGPSEGPFRWHHAGGKPGLVDHTSY